MIVIALRIVRTVFAGFYIFVGVQTALALSGVIPTPDFDLSARNAAFQEALGETGFIVPLMAFFFVFSGLLMMADRTTPVGIILLAPFVVVIFFTHLILDGNVLWGLLNLGVLLLFAFQFRSSFVPLWNASKRTGIHGQ